MKNQEVDRKPSTFAQSENHDIPQKAFYLFPTFKILNMNFLTTRSMVALAVFCLMATALMAQQPKNVIVFIGDGYGIAPRTAARMALGQGQDDSRFSDDPNFRLMAADNLKYTAMVTSHSMNSWVTDSAPGATVYAAGKKGKIHNEAVAFNMDANTPVETILEYAKKQGYAVGLVTTTRVTHATPADFASHVWNRDLEDIIAAQYISSSQAEYAAIFGAGYDPVNKHWELPSPKVGVELDVILGAGARHFLPKTAPSPYKAVVDKNGNPVMNAAGTAVNLSGSRVDNLDLIQNAKDRGFVYVNSRDALRNLDLNQFANGNNKKLLGLFQSSMMDYEQDRQLNYPWEPSLADMTEIAIEVLKRKGGSKGFFLMVEGGRIDHLEHANAGGITYAPGTTTMSVSADKETFSPDDVYVSATAPVVPGIYGSDYLIKEVLAFDYAIQKGRNLLQDNNRQTLIFSTSDHECGGLTVVGLHDEADAQQNGTKIRTYAKTPKQDAASGNGTNPKPAGLTPGANWFPSYELYDFQGYKYPKPTSATTSRIVISYGSNPVVNGNNPNLGGTPGNHTPQDVWVGSDDNMNGAWASKITGRGLLDNTDLTPIIKDFYGFDKYSVWDYNMGMTLTANHNTYCQYNNVTFTMTVRNNDDYAANNVEVEFKLPQGTAYVWHLASKGLYQQYCPGGALCQTWSIPTLAPGEEATLSLTVFALTNGTPMVAKAKFLSSTLTPNHEESLSLAYDCNAFNNNGNSNKSFNLDGKTGNIEIMNVYPNPATDDVNLSFGSDFGTAASLQVLDLNGQVMMTDQLDLSKGMTSYFMSVKEFPSGTYFVLVSNGETSSVSARIVKQ